jgi:hypothetical protein
MIRPAANGDLEAILPVYEAARRYMCAHGNPTQWRDGYPTRALLEGDIEKHQLYVCENDGRIYGAFVLQVGIEPTYAVIDDGAWKNDLPYATIHRVGADGSRGGVFAECLAFSRAHHPNIRIDTHRDNKTMQHLIEKHGFSRCGIVHMRDGSDRIAYQWTNESAAEAQ